MSDCVFCEIIQKNIPSYIVYEDVEILAILPKDMEVFGHTLVIPKQHYENIYDIDPSTLEKLITTVKNLAVQYQETIGATGINILHASGKDANQSVFHFHFHIIPRFPEDGMDTRPKFPPFEMDHQTVLEKLRKQN